jgi:hypothetical protein
LRPPDAKQLAQEVESLAAEQLADDLLGRAASTDGPAGKAGRRKLAFRCRVR